MAVTPASRRRNLPTALTSSLSSSCMTSLTVVTAQMRSGCGFVHLARAQDGGQQIRRRRSLVHERLRSQPLGVVGQVWVTEAAQHDHCTWGCMKQRGDKRQAVLASEVHIEDDYVRVQRSGLIERFVHRCGRAHCHEPWMLCVDETANAYANGRVIIDHQNLQRACASSWFHDFRVGCGCFTGEPRVQP
jgi:hypothetical protein